VQTNTGETYHEGKRNVEKALENLSGHVLYALDSLESFIHTTGALSWTMAIWKGRITRATHNATRVSVVSLRGTLPQETAFEDLERVLSWLRSYGVAPASIPAMAWGLFRASLPRSYSCGFDPETGRAAFYGGRQEVTQTGTFRNMIALDIKSAYPAAMARPEGYALSLREVDASTTLDQYAAGISEARVHVPHYSPHALLPVRVSRDTISFQRGDLEGLWPWCELVAAMRLGAEVEILRSWAPARCADLFGPWWPLAEEGRNLPGGAGQLAKAISQSTWGQFGMSAEERGRRQYTDDYGKNWLDVPLPDHELPHSWTAHIAAETTGRVRAQMLDAIAITDPVHIDTDGLLVSAGTETPGGGTGAPGQWRVKTEMDTLEIRGPQLYRWQCPKCGAGHECGPWHYTTSGIPADEAAEFFSRDAAPEITVKESRRF
jgi:hypothetical protein